MSVRLMADVFEHSEARGNDRLVLLAIADEADDDGKGGYPGFALLSKKCRVPQTTVRRAVARLEALGELRVFPPEKRGRGHYTTYELLIGKKAATLAHSGNGPQRAGKGHKEPERATTSTPTSSDAEYAVPRTRDAERNPTDFDRFWAVYPRRVAREAAMRAWDRAVRVAGSAQTIIAGAERYSDDPNREQEFTKHPATWLNGGCWDDEPLPPRNGHRQAPNRPDPNRNLSTNTTYGRVTL